MRMGRGRSNFTTLREEPTELVSKKTLEKRRADMIWSADTTDGRRVVFLIEFQRKAEWRMAVRTQTYASLMLERINPGDPLPELVCLVLYHGDGPWRGPDHVTSLFKRSDPGRFHLVSWKDENTGRPAKDLAALLLGLARNLPPEEMAAQAAALRLKLAELGNPRLDAVLAEKVRTMLGLRGYTGILKLEGAETMEETVDRFQQGLQDLVQRGAREGRREGQKIVLRRQVARRFGEETAGRVSEVLEGLPGTDAIDMVTDALFECGTGEEFVERLRTA